MTRPIRLALVADLHCRPETQQQLREGLAPANDEADVLLLGGDLCNMGRAEEGRALQEVLRPIRIPMVAVLGDHDYHSGLVGNLVAMLTDVGVHLLQGSAHVARVNGETVGIVGAKGFCGGYGTYCLTPFGESGIKQFIGETRHDAQAVNEALGALQTDYRVVMFHYAPIRDTLFGEPAELYPFLGSSILAEPVEQHGCDLVVHGHAHHGVEDGETQAGIPVKNVAMPVIKRPYVLHSLERNGKRRKRRR